MAKARVTLREDGPRSLFVNGTKWEQGVARILTDESEIARCRLESGTFVVQHLDDETEKPIPPPELEAAAESDEAPKKSKKSKKPKAEEPSDEDGGEDSDDADESDDEESLEDESSVGLLSEDEMRSMTKKNLLAAAESRGIPGLSDNMTKADIIAKVLLAQKD